jgi:serine/threonine protein kinase
LGRNGGFAHKGMYKIENKWIMKVTNLKEYTITHHLQGHDNIVSMMPMSQRSGKYASVVMEYCDKGNLSNCDITEIGKQNIIEDIAKGVGHMLSKGYIQNDLWRERGEHLSNFFVRKNGTVVLGDFGNVSKVTNKNLSELMKQLDNIIEYINIYC